MDFRLNDEMTRLGFCAGILLGILSIATSWPWVVMAIWMLAFLAIGGHEGKLRGAISSALGQTLGLALVIAIFSPYMDTVAPVAATIWAFAAVVVTACATEMLSRFWNHGREQAAN